MLSPESLPPSEAARPSSPEVPGDSHRPDSSLTVLKRSGSSVDRHPGSSLVGPSPIPLPRSGEMIGTFRLEDAIGVGGMAAVFRALDTQLDRLVALKLLPPDQAVDPEVVQRFYQEGRSAAQLDHENIARVFSIGQDGPFHYIAFEYIEGVTLRQRVDASGPLAPAQAVDVTLQIANALIHASRRGVVHRDIKPSNIILAPQGRAKLVDMGLARRFERGGDRGLTQSGMTLGTFDYISPEQARDPRDVDARSDLYSLGCTLFHMLTGRPPFPGGTVLQKLLQHQEEPPADVRTLNPDVPAELAAILVKLMAKERDRRYQSPEHLARDLLARASALGLERVPTELESWMVHGHHAWWERHLVWVVPVVGFIMIVGSLAWWGRNSSTPAGDGRGTAAASPAREKSELNITDSPRGADGTIASESPGGEAGSRAPVAAPFPRTIPVGSEEDLHDVLARAPRGSVIVLDDDGPYRVGGRAWSARNSALPADPDLTIKAELGVRPLLKLADDGGVGNAGPRSILDFVGGRVVLDGIAFECDVADAGEPVSAIRCDQTELVLRGCSFRRPPPTAGADRDPAAIVIRSSRRASTANDRPPAVLADSCHFDGGQVAVRAEGRADVTLRDCTLGPAAPSIWFDEARSDSPVPHELRLIHTSILAGAGPVFRFAAGAVRVRVDDCVIAPAAQSATALVLIEDPRNLNWRGRSNLYGSIAPFLATPGHAPQRTTIADFATWAQGPTEPRELGSAVASTPVWQAADPLEALRQERENPTRVFLLAPRIAAASAVGARQGPFGSSLTSARLAQRGAGPRAAATDPPRADGPTAGGEKPAKRADAPVAALTPPTTPGAAGEPTSADDDATTPVPDPMNLSSMPPMATASGAQADAESKEEVADRPNSAPDPDRPAPARTSTPARTPVARSAPPLRDEDIIHGAEQFQTVLRHLGVSGGTLRIAAGVDLELSSIGVECAAGGQVRIVAEPGRSRPRLRLRPAAIASGSAADWNGLFNLRSGALRLEGLDLVVPAAEAAPADRLAAIAMVVGTKLTLEDCTITIEVARSTAIAVAGPSASGRAARVAMPATAVIEVRDGFLRSGGDAVTVAGGSRLALDLRNVMVATEGSLLHAQGGPRTPRPAAAPGPAVTVRLDRAAIRSKGGLVHLQTTRDEPDMAAVAVRADRSIVSTITGDRPLFRLEGQEEIERLRDKVRWEGHQVAYHRIKIYRRDEILKVGGLPRIYERDDWTRAFSPTDDSPTLADLKFRREADASVPAWKVVRDDLRLASGSTPTPLGPDAGKVPEPPADEDF